MPTDNRLHATALPLLHARDLLQSDGFHRQTNCRCPVILVDLLQNGNAVFLLPLRLDQPAHGVVARR